MVLLLLFVVILIGGGGGSGGDPVWQVKNIGYWFLQTDTGCLPETVKMVGKTWMRFGTNDTSGPGYRLCASFGFSVFVFFLFFVDSKYVENITRF